MKLNLQFGQQHGEFKVAADKLLSVDQPALQKGTADPAALLRNCLENPTGYPSLRLALTPDDHVAVVLDPRLPRLDVLLTALLEHLQKAGVESDAVTLVVADEPSDPNWRDLLGPWKEKLKLEVHDPTNRDKLSYLAATQKGRRIYINRTVVDADQVVVLARAGYDWARGYTGGAAAIFPALSDQATRQEFAALTESFADGRAAEVFLTEGEESAWLLGAPFFVQVIEGAGDAIAQIVAGVATSLGESRSRLEAAWALSSHHQAALVIANVTDSRDRLGLHELAGAAAKAANFVQSDGVVAVVFPANFELDDAMGVVCQSSDAVEAVKRLHRQKTLDPGAALQWLSAVGRARVYVLSQAPDEIVEEMLAVPLEKFEQLQKLVDGAESVMLLVDPQKIVTGPAHVPAEKKASVQKGRARRS